MYRIKNHSITLLKVSFLTLLYCILFAGVAIAAEESWSVSSPDGSIKVNILRSEDGSLRYNVKKDGLAILNNSSLGITTSNCDFNNDLAVSEEKTIPIDESYPMAVGKKAIYINKCNEIALNITKNKTKNMNIIFRAYNDGVAFRYSLPSMIGVNSEKSQFALPSGICWIGDEDSNYEMDFNKMAIYEATSISKIYNMCPVFKLDNESYVWISEADLYGDYCSSNLKSSGLGDGVFDVVNITGSPASKSTSKSPWRVVAIGSSPSTLIDTTIVENLNPANELLDTSWVLSGGCAWTWLNGDSCNSLDEAKRYIDFASSMGWKYYMADEGWSAKWAPEMCSYANSKNIGVILWVDQDKLSNQKVIDQKLTLWAGWGAKGIKVDYFAGNGQDDNLKRARITEKAAQLHLVVNFHGTVKPTGQQRKWPNILTWEAVKGNENNPDAVYLNTIPFTRCVAGPSDITPVFIRSQDKGFNVKTDSFETATALTIMSNYICYAEKPIVYETFAAREFLKILPGSYDETRYIEGSIGDYITVARRKNKDWFIGGTTVKARTSNVDLSFLGDGTYIATIYKDKSSGKDIEYSTQTVTNKTTLNIPCLDNGGFVVYISSKALPKPAENLSIGKTIKASSASNNSKPEKAIDGNENTSWIAANSKNQWIQVDLNKVTTINKVIIKIKEYSKRIKGYDLEYSSDGTNWYKIKSGTEIREYKVEGFSPVDARYVRISITKANGLPIISEFEIYNDEAINVTLTK